MLTLQKSLTSRLEATLTAKQAVKSRQQNRFYIIIIHFGAVSIGTMLTSDGNFDRHIDVTCEQALNRECIISD